MYKLPCNYFCQLLCQSQIYAAQLAITLRGFASLCRKNKCLSFAFFWSGYKHESFVWHFNTSLTTIIHSIFNVFTRSAVIVSPSNDGRYSCCCSIADSYVTTMTSSVAAVTWCLFIFVAGEWRHPVPDNRVLDSTLACDRLGNGKNG